MKRNVSGLSTGKPYFILENFKPQSILLALVPEEEISDWETNLNSLGQFFGAPSVYAYHSADKFQKLSILKSLSNNKSGIVVASKEIFYEKIIHSKNLHNQILKFELGNTYEFNSLINRLVTAGYSRSEFVEEKGQFSRRGEILDIWSIDAENPVRIIFYNDQVETIKTFDLVTQLSSDVITSCEITPAALQPETLISDYLPKSSEIYFDFLPDNETPKIFAEYSWIINNSLETNKVQEDFKSFAGIRGNFQFFVNELKRIKKEGLKEYIFCSNNGEKERIEDILNEAGWDDDFPQLTITPLTEGFYSKSRKIAFFSSQEILYKKKLISFPKFKEGRRLEGLWEITKGDYVVHEKYGIGRYLGLNKLVRGDQEAEYLFIEYKGGDKLYVPVDDFEVVKKYIGTEGYRPKLFSLDTASWERIKQKAKEGAREFAESLLKLYAERHNAQGFAFTPDTPWEKELADSFPYQETPDQAKAIEDVKIDLKNPYPMERIICGDVGFGKTEVAIRASFKVVQDSKQVAVLVPTTVLAEQHFNTFSRRLEPFPTKVAFLSRFQSKAEQKKIISDLKSGSIDIIIGTHRLLQKDITFKDLGLLIIDEEHRFGVEQKEKIKKFKKNIDVLLMSATPIPRTLSFALSKLRDLSVIETPPYGRLPIETHLGPYDEKIVKKIIEAELSRGGQVFYVHNRVETINSRGEYLKKLVPNIRWGIVHGQMRSHDIEKAMWLFIHKEIDVLISTSIIESGLDIPTVNSMIVEEAENFGLAQLYQLRGRVGREKQKAYCYLFYTPELVTEESSKRLEALMEFSELGSGFRLALRDLEIRGAGNILSAKQHGFVKEIGFEMYGRLIEEASQSLKGEKAVKEEFKTIMDFLIPAHIPQEYVEAEDIRVTFYRKLAASKNKDDIEKIKSDLTDRFGKLPKPVENLFEITEIKFIAEKRRINSIVENDKFINIYFSDKIAISQAKILEIANTFAGKIEFLRGEKKGIKVIKSNIEKPYFAFLKDFLSSL
ncbi:MAG: transcription-repair coupling factor [Elusimicrobia bacterium]|nr:transcription-repair coupling factor [Elusimicrobiota bacterium]